MERLRIEPMGPRRLLAALAGAAICISSMMNSRFTAAQQALPIPQNSIPQQSDSLVDVSPNQNIDESKLLVSALEFLYATWPKEEDKTKVLATLEEKRKEATAFQG